MDTHEQPQEFPPDSQSPPGWAHGWTFRLSSDEAPRIVSVDPDTVAAARAAARAMQDALLEAQRQSVLVDEAVASLAHRGASASQIMGAVGLSMHTAEDLIGGMPMLESVCRDGVAHAEGQRRDRANQQG